MNLQSIKSSLHWHLLNAISSGYEIRELMAAASDDGIGMIVRWKKEADGWEVEAMDTEGGGWDYVEFYEEGCQIPVEPPFEFAPAPPSLSFDPTDPEILWILGLMCFQCGPIAHVLQAAGHAIEKRAEAEQAHVILWLIRKYQEHGEGWREKVNEELSALRKANSQTRCGILGCGNLYPSAQMRIYRLGPAPVPCCPECWKSMELPEECRDTADLGQNAPVLARKPAPSDSDS